VYQAEDKAQMMVFEYLSDGNLSALLQREGKEIKQLDLVRM
jgi:hypothetical protein